MCFKYNTQCLFVKNVGHSLIKQNYYCKIYIIYNPVMTKISANKKLNEIISLLEVKPFS